MEVLLESTPVGSRIPGIRSGCFRTTWLLHALWFGGWLGGCGFLLHGPLLHGSALHGPLLHGALLHGTLPPSQLPDALHDPLPALAPIAAAALPLPAAPLRALSAAAPFASFTPESALAAAASLARGSAPAAFPAASPSTALLGSLLQTEASGGANFDLPALRDGLSGSPAAAATAPSAPAHAAHALQELQVSGHALLAALFAVGLRLATASATLH